MQLQAKAFKFKTATANRPGLAINPVVQLPRKASSDDSGAVLRRGGQCFIPITTLAEQPCMIRMYVNAAVHDRNESVQQGECIELDSQDIARQQGVYQCTSFDGPQYVCLQVTSKPAQVRMCQQ